MNLPELKALDRIIALCRKRGVQVIKIDNIEITLGEAPPVRETKKSKASAPYTGETEIEELSEEDLLFYSVHPTPSEDGKLS